MAETTQAEPEVEQIAPNCIHLWVDPASGDWFVAARGVAGPGALEPGERFIMGRASTPAHALQRALLHISGENAPFAFDPSVPAPVQWRR